LGLKIDLTRVQRQFQNSFAEHSFAQAGNDPAALAQDEFSASLKRPVEFDAGAASVLQEM
jgi:hypothetical protein